MPYAGICYGIFGHGDLRLVAVSVTVGKSQLPAAALDSSHSKYKANIGQMLTGNSNMRYYKNKILLLSL